MIQDDIPNVSPENLANDSLYIAGRVLSSHPSLFVELNQREFMAAQRLVPQFKSSEVFRSRLALPIREKSMANLIAIAFDEPAKAFDLRARLVELQKEYLIDMEDIVIVTRNEHGKIKLHQATSLTAAGVLGGSFWGLLIGMLFLNPLLGLAAGVSAGAISGYLNDLGINDNFMKQVGKRLQPGGAAVFVLVRKATDDKIIDRLRDFAGTGRILKTSLSKESEEELKKVFEKADKFGLAQWETTPVVSLTQRIMKLTAEGKSIREVSDSLGVPKSTVQYHMDKSV